MYYYHAVGEISTPSWDVRYRNDTTGEDEHICFARNPYDACELIDWLEAHDAAEAQIVHEEEEMRYQDKLHELGL